MDNEALINKVLESKRKETKSAEIDVNAFHHGTPLGLPRYFQNALVLKMYDLLGIVNKELIKNTFFKALKSKNRDVKRYLNTLYFY